MQAVTKPPNNVGGIESTKGELEQSDCYVIKGP